MVIDIRCHGVQSRHLPPPSPEVEFTAQSQSRTPIRACSGWPQHSDCDSKTLATTDAQAVWLKPNLKKNLYSFTVKIRLDVWDSLILNEEEKTA
jgi:hypothetical protein